MRGAGRRRLGNRRRGCTWRIDKLCFIFYIRKGFFKCILIRRNGFVIGIYGLLGVGKGRFLL
jgi:hypothetical protein